MKVSPLAAVAVFSGALAFAFAFARPAHADDAKQKDRGGELALLYVASIGWAGTIPIFIDGLAHQNQPAASSDFGASLLVPLVAPVGVAIPLIVDVAYGHRRGVPQTITSSMLIGLGEGVALNEYFANRANTSFHTFSKDASWVFGATTLGLVAGLTIAAVVPTTPGRAAWVATTGLFSGVFVASLTGAVSRPSDPSTGFDREGRRDAALAGAIGGGGGVIAGLSTATLFSPSELRVHLIDLGWIAGAAISGAACNDKCSAPDAFAAVAVGSAVGFVATFLATLRMRPDGRPPSLHPTTTITPYAMPIASGGLEVGVAASL